MFLEEKYVIVKSAVVVKTTPMQYFEARSSPCNSLSGYGVDSGKGVEPGDGIPHPKTRGQSGERTALEYVLKFDRQAHLRRVYCPKFRMFENDFIADFFA